jgi:transcription elongation factor
MRIALFGYEIIIRKITVEHLKLPRVTMSYKVLESHKEGDITIIDKVEIESISFIPRRLKEEENVLSNS